MQLYNYLFVWAFPYPRIFINTYLLVPLYALLMSRLHINKLCFSFFELSMSLGYIIHCSRIVSKTGLCGIQQIIITQVSHNVCGHHFIN